MTRRVLTLTACALFGCALTAAAQTPAQAPRRNRELSFGGIISTPSSMGSADAQLQGPSGDPILTLFSTENWVTTGIGADVTLGFRMRGALWMEFSGALTRASLRTRITDDFEGAAEEVIGGPVLRISAEAALAWQFRERANSSWFVRASGGLIRETSGELFIAEQGFTASGGVGGKWWLKTNKTGTFKRVGIRAEGRVAVRSSGISLGSQSLQFGPMGIVHVIFAY